MAARFSKTWSDEIAEESTRGEYQTCRIEIQDPSAIRYPGPNYVTDPTDLTTVGYDPKTDTYKTPVVTGVVYSGQARFIPVRGSIYYGGEAQANATNIRTVRFQIPHASGPLYIRMGLTLLIKEAPRNPSLVGRRATVTEDFQGGSSAARTINASMDIDAEPDDA